MPRTTFRTALVTGASSGIGREFARELVSRGASVTVVARRRDRLEQLQAELGPERVEVLAADLSTEPGIATVERRLTERPVELLVNNAGVSRGGRFAELPADQLADVVAVDVVALHRLTRAAAPAMVAGRHGGILNVSSIAGEQPLRGFASYAAAKAFVTVLSESLAAELRPSGVHVTVLKPGYVYTEMTPDAPDPRSLVGRLWLTPDLVARRALDCVENGRLICVPGPHWRAVSGLISAIPRPALRAITARFDAAGASADAGDREPGG